MYFALLSFAPPMGYQNIGNLFNVTASLGLLFNIIASKSAVGVSGKTQLSFLLAHALRLLSDVASFPNPDYDRITAALFIVASAVTTYCIYFQFRDTYDDKWDTFRVQYVMPLMFIFSLAVHWWGHRSFIISVLSAFSFYLEMLAFVPQFTMSFRMHQVKPVMVYYVLGLLGYQTFYLCYWIYMWRYVGRDPIASNTCPIQLLTYLAFFFVLKVEDEDYDSENVSLEKHWNNQLQTGTNPSQPRRGILIIGGSSSPGIKVALRYYYMIKKECFGLFVDHTNESKPDGRCESQCVETCNDTKDTEKTSITHLPVQPSPPDICSITIDDLPEKPKP